VTASWATTLNPGLASNKKAAITQSLECNFALTEDNAKRVLISLFGDRSLFTDDAMEVRKRFTPRRSGLVGALLMKAELKSQAPFAQRAEKNYQNPRPELSLFPGILWRVLGAGRGLRIAPLGEPSSASIYGASRPRTAICQRRVSRRDIETAEGCRLILPRVIHQLCCEGPVPFVLIRG